MTEQAALLVYCITTSMWAPSSRESLDRRTHCLGKQLTGLTVLSRICCYGECGLACSLILIGPHATVHITAVLPAAGFLRKFSRVEVTTRRCPPERHAATTNIRGPSLSHEEPLCPMAEHPKSRALSLAVPRASMHDATRMREGQQYHDVLPRSMTRAGRQQAISHEGSARPV